MEAVGFLVLCAFAGIVFVLIQEFRWKSKADANVRGHEENQIGVFSKVSG